MRFAQQTTIYVEIIKKWRGIRKEVCTQAEEEKSLSTVLSPLKSTIVSSEAAFEISLMYKSAVKVQHIHRCAKVSQKEYLCLFPFLKTIKKLFPQNGCFACQCKLLSGTPATLPCRNCAFNTRCPDKYFIFSRQADNNVG